MTAPKQNKSSEEARSFSMPPMGGKDGGLSLEEARARLLRDGPNELPAAAEANRVRQLLRHFASPVVIALLAALVVTGIDHGFRSRGSFLVAWGDAFAIALMVLLNGIRGYVQERRADEALDALKRKQELTAKVLRGGARTEVPSRELVVGDVLLLEAGDAIPADALLRSARGLWAEESAFTGESRPVEKLATSEELAPATMPPPKNSMFPGATVVRGRGTAVVVATGARSGAGRAKSMAPPAAQPVQKDEPKIGADIKHVGTQILWGCLALSLLAVARGFFGGEQTWSELVLEAVSLAVAAIPQGLPHITTTTLALGMKRMGERGAIVKRLTTVETLGTTSLICADKTGTLTENSMAVRELFAGGVAFSVTGPGYAPKGEITARGKREGTSVRNPVVAVQEACRACTNSDIRKDDSGAYVADGDATEAALVSLSRKGGGIPPKGDPGAGERAREIMFDSERRRMSVVHEIKGAFVVFSKGSPDVVLSRCTRMRTGNGDVEMDEESSQELIAIADEMSERGLRVLAVARRDLPSSWDVHTVNALGDNEIESDLTFLGFVGMTNRSRAGTKAAIETCKSAGVRVVMITGDHKNTAIAAAKEMALWDDSAEALSGPELALLSDDEFTECRGRVRVFARITPDQRLRIARAFKADGHVVAMTGSGVNDAPALREAQVGIAPGRTGTDVARAAAAMVIADDDFATIVLAIREGRAIYRNIQKAMFFLLSSNAALVLVVLVGSFVTRLMPLTPLMILWINFVTNGLPALGLEVDPADPSLMAEEPRKAERPVLAPGDYAGILLPSLWMGGAAMAIYMWPGYQGSAGPAEGRALTFSFLALAPLLYAFACRSHRTSIFALRPAIAEPLMRAVAISAGIHFISLALPDAREVFQTYWISAVQWLVILGLAASVVLFSEVLKARARQSSASPSR